MKRILYDKKEISREYKAKATICANGYLKIRLYDKPLKKLPEGWELEDISSDESESIVQQALHRYDKDDDELKVIEKRSLNVTKNKLIEYAAMNAEQWKSFVTLTFAENLGDVTEANKKFKSYITKMRRKKPDFAYLGVPEFQQRGAVHYHLLTNLIPGIDIPAREPKKTYNPKKDKYYEVIYYDIPYWCYGFSSAFDLNMTDPEFNVALYMCKYLFKDVDNRLWGRHKILRSNNLKKPDIYYLANEDVYEKAVEYCIKKGYEPELFRYRSEVDYIPCYRQLTVNLSQKDYNIFRDRLKDITVI